MSKEQIKSDYTIRESTLGELLSDKSICVPRFHGQRGYIWKDSQISEYVKDIMNGNFPGTVMLALDGKNKYLIDFCQRYRALKKVKDDWDKWTMTADDCVEAIFDLSKQFYPDMSDFDRMSKSQAIADRYLAAEDGEHCSLRLLFYGMMGRIDANTRSDFKRECDQLKSLMDGRIENGASLDDVKVPVIEFASMEAAINSYVKMNMGSRALNETDLKRVYWDACTIKLPDTESGNRILKALDTYYRMMNEKTEREASVHTRSDMLTERIAEDGTIEETPREFFYESSYEIIKTRTITLYELCCALGFIFYDAAPTFVIEDRTSAQTSDYQASKMGIIFLSPVFDLSPNSNRIISGLGDNISHIIGEDVIESNLDTIVECVQKFGERFEKEYAERVFGSLTPSPYIFETLITILFRGEWEFNYRLDGSELRKEEQLTGRHWDEMSRVLFDLAVLSLVSGNMAKRVFSISATKTHYEELMKKLIERVEDNITTDDLLQSLPSRADRVRDFYSVRDMQIIYAMFRTLMCGTENSNCYEFSTIFDPKICNSALGRSVINETYIDLGNMIFRPVSAPDGGEGEPRQTHLLYIKDNISLLDQVDKTDGMLTTEMLKAIRYPGAESVIKRGKGRPKKESVSTWKNNIGFEQIRTALMKNRPKLYKEYVEGREKYIIETLEKMLRGE